MQAPTKSIPEELRSLPKSEVTFFLDKIPAALKPNTYPQFLKLLQLYTDGLITKFEFMSLVEDFKVSDAAEDTFKNLASIISAREDDRKTKNFLMKPLSEIDVKKFFSEKDHITKSYYRLPVDFHNPICTGRYLPEDEEACKTLNDFYCSISGGAELFKNKNK